MDKTQQYKEWFDEYNKEWLVRAYDQSDYDYPVGRHRLRILLKALEKEDLREKSILDIGCGGGDVSFALAQKGASVIGIDMSDNMLKVANARKAEVKETLSGKVEFRKENIQALSTAISGEKFDYIIAFGLIGYLESDEQFFRIIGGLSKANTILFLSCRNELFNVTSISPNTVEEIKRENILNLIEEMDMYYSKDIPEEKSWKFLNELSNSIRSIHELEERNYRNLDIINDVKIDESKMISFARQSTPEELKNTAKINNYNFCQYWGVHPHLLLPKLNRKLPPKIFNLLSDSLCVFEEEEISLVWSSVFIGKFNYTGK